MKNTNNITDDYRVASKLLDGISAFNSNEPLSKGQKTAYGQAASFPKEVLEQYISETEEIKKKDKKVKAPNVKSFIIYAKSKLYTNFGRKVQLFPTPEQEKQLLFYVDAYRWTYNFLYAHRRDNAVIPWRKQCVSAHYTASIQCKPVVLPKFPSWQPDYKLVSQKSGNRPDWMKNAPTAVVNSCVHSFPKKPSGFRSKAEALAEFVILQGDHISINTNGIKLPKISAIRHSCPNYLPLNAKLCSIGISLKNGKWYAGITFQSKDPKTPLRTEGKRVGIDVGARRLATTWNGDYHAAYSKNRSERLLRLEKDKQRWERAAARRFIKGAKQQSNRYQYAQDQVRRLYEKIRNIRNDNAHQVSHRILRDNVKEIVIETLNVKGMMTKSKKKGKKKTGRQLRKLMAEAAVSRLLSFVSYKSEWRGINKIKTDRFFASSKTCHCCKIKNVDLGSGEYWICPTCNTRHQRDENASKNLWAYGPTDFEVAQAASERPEGPPDSKGQAITEAIASVAC